MGRDVPTARGPRPLPRRRGIRDRGARRLRWRRRARRQGTRSSHRRVRAGAARVHAHRRSVAGHERPQRGARGPLRGRDLLLSEREGLVEGTPSDDELDELPPAVGLGSRSSGCQNASLQPTAGNLGQLEAPIRCLLNAERRARGLAALKPDQRLRNAAVAHSRDMVVKRYFAHRSQSGSSPAARIRAAGWIPRQGRWIVGENIAWGSGSLVTPAKIVRAWMAALRSWSLPGSNR